MDRFQRGKVKVCEIMKILMAMHPVVTRYFSLDQSGESTAQPSAITIPGGMPLAGLNTRQ